MKLHKRWFVVGTEDREIHDGFSEKQAVVKHTYGNGSKDYHVLVATAQTPFAPKGRKPREHEAFVTKTKGGEIVHGNCNLRSVYKIVSGKKIES